MVIDQPYLEYLFYGVVECDVQVPEQLKDYFAEIAENICDADDIFSFSDEQLKQETDLVHQPSVKAFARPLAKVRRPEVDTHTLQ